MPEVNTRLWRSARSYTITAWSAASAGWGTACDNALMESTIGLYKTELFHVRATGWQSRQEVETATARWVAWFNRDRLHSELNYATPLEVEAAYIHQQALPMQAA